MFDEWKGQPITRMIMGALNELSVGRVPAMGLQTQDFALVVGELAGMQRAAAALRNPEVLLSSIGLTTDKPRGVLPKATYAPAVMQAPVPPPENEGRKA